VLPGVLLEYRRILCRVAYRTAQSATEQQIELYDLNEKRMRHNGSGGCAIAAVEVLRCTETQDIDHAGLISMEALTA
jgi:hypothetical protein